MAPNPYTKQYLMTAGPTPVPPAVSQAMATPMLYHRAPAFVELYERVLAKLPKVFQTSNDVLTFAASGSGAMDSAVANLVRPGTKTLAAAVGKFGERWIELNDAYGAESDALRAGLGRAAGPAGVRPPAQREPRHRDRLRHAERDEHRHRQRHPGDRRGHQPPRQDPRGRRGLRPRRRRAQAGRVGRRRRRRGQPEGADDPARARVRLRLPEGARLRRSSVRAAATTSTGSRPRSPSARATRPSRPPCRSSRRSTSRST